MSKEMQDIIEDAYECEIDRLLMTGKPICREDEICIRTSIVLENLQGWI